MYLEKPVLIKAKISFWNSITIKDYTAKLVKTMLISGNPKLQEVFSRRRNMPPKPIHITPLYRVEEDGGGAEAVYTRYVPKRSNAKPPKLHKLKPIRIKRGEEYIFYIGVSMNLLNDVLLGLSNAGRFGFGGETIDIHSLTYEIQYVDTEEESAKIAEILRQAEEDYKTLKITFTSPTLLKDPLVVARKRKKKLLLPLPEAILATPFLMVLIDKGELRKSTFLRCMRYMKSIFDIPYTILKTVNLVWYVYDDTPLPAIIGYAKYFIDCRTLAFAEAKLMYRYGLDFIDALSKSIVLAQVYGVGDSRATGFGHVSITLK